MKIIIFLTSIFALLFSGCVIKQPKIPKYSIEQGDQIGYLIHVAKYPKHSHLGTTVFNNFTKEYAYDWDIENYIEKSLQQSLSKKGRYKLINLKKTQITFKDLDNLIVAEDNKWIVNKGKNSMFDTLKDKHNLKAIIEIYDGRKLMQAIYGPYSSIYYYAEGYGLFTRSFLGIDTYFPAPSFSANVYILNPIAKIIPKCTTKMPYQGFSQMTGMFANKEENQKHEFIVPKDFKNISEKEFEPIKHRIYKFLDELNKEINSYL